MEPDIKVMLVFVAFGVVLGLASGIIELSGRIGALLALAVFYVSIRVAPRILEEEERESFDSGTLNLVKTGALPYWFLWLVSWTLIYSITFY